MPHRVMGINGDRLYENTWLACKCSRFIFVFSLASWDVYSYGERADQFSGLLPGHQIFIDLGGEVEAEIR